MKIANHWCRWTAALVVGLLATGGVAAQSPPLAKAAAPAQVAKPAKKSVKPAFKMVLEPRAMELSNWQLDGTFAPDTFASPKAQAAKRIAFASPVAGLPQTAKPTAGAKPAKAAAPGNQPKSQ